MQRLIILGKPNAGKSSLFNCFLKQKEAITSPIEGTTRDINIKHALFDDLRLVICDTAGIIKNKIAKNIAMNFIEGNDIVLYLLDASKPIDEYDIKSYRSLKNAILVANKIDIAKNEEWEYSVFGAKAVFFISALKNIGLKKLKDHIKLLIRNENPKLDSIHSDKKPKLDSMKEENNAINIGIIGRVNVGKSSLLNALVNKNRSIVSDVAGTTRDPVDDYIEHGEFILNFVDTAGIRRPSKIENIEKYALLRTKKVLEKSDIALLVLDASSEFVDLDEKIGGLSDTYNLGVIIVLNKWDIKYCDFKKMENALRRKFAYLSYAPLITISALNKYHIDKLKNKILEVYANFSRRIGTSLLNTTIQEAISKHPLPSSKGKIIKIYYATQIDSNPPKIVLIMNRAECMHFSYKRYLINALRRKFDFTGSPILIHTRSKNKINASDLEI